MKQRFDDVVIGIEKNIVICYMQNRLFLLKYRQIFQTYKEYTNKLTRDHQTKIGETLDQIEILDEIITRELQRYIQLSSMEEMKIVFLKVLSYSLPIFQLCQGLLVEIQTTLKGQNERLIIIYRCEVITASVIQNFQQLEQLFRRFDFTKFSFQDAMSTCKFLDVLPQTINRGLTKLTVLAFKNRPSYADFESTCKSLESSFYKSFKCSYKSNEKLSGITKREYKGIMEKTFLGVSELHQKLIEIFLFHLTSLVKSKGSKNSKTYSEIINMFHEAFIFIKMFSTSEEQASVTRDSIISINNLVLKPLEFYHDFEYKNIKSTFEGVMFDERQLLQISIIQSIKEANQHLNANVHKLDTFLKNPSVLNGFLLSKNEYQVLLMELNHKIAGSHIDLTNSNFEKFELFKDLEHRGEILDGFTIAATIDF